MVKKYLSLFPLIGLYLLMGCTVAVPEVSSLGSVLFMTSKSPSPFDQDNDNEFIQFSGQCVSLVTRFQYRLDDLPWRDVPPTMPTPGPGEIAPDPNVYDVDCSDGSYDFYLYMSQVNAYLSDHTGNPNYDPARVEVQGLDATENVVPGTLIFQRPIATGLRLEPSDYSNSAAWWLNTLETDQTVRFRVVLIDSLGQQTRRFSSQTDLDVSFTSTVISGSSPSVGEFTLHSGSSCSGSAQSTFTFTAGGGNEYLDICFTALDVTAGSTVRLSISAPGFATQERQFTILGLYQAYNSLIAGNGYWQKLPQTLVRGAVYKFKSDLNPLNSTVDRFVSTFDGSFLVNAQSSFVSFARASRQFNCGSVGTQNSQIQCTNSNESKSMPFLMSVSPNYASGSLHLILNSTPVASCSNCTILDAATPYPISGYQENHLLFNVVSGSTVYSRPQFEFFRRQSPGACHEINLSLANSDGNTIPANRTNLNPTPVFTLETSTADVRFFQNSDCTALSQSGPNGSVDKIIPANNGQFFIIGDFTSYNGHPRNGIALINEDGSLDTSYMPSGVSGMIYDLLPLDDNRALIAGSFSGGLQLLDENGQQDPTFNFSLNNTAYSLARQVISSTTEHYLVAGAFTELVLPSPTLRNKILKIIKTTNSETGVETYALSSDLISLSGTFINKILIHENYLYITGDFTTPTQRIARLNLSNLSLDFGWPNSSLGANNLVNTMEIDSSNSRILMGGNFTSVLGQSRSYFASISLTTGALVSYTTNPVFNAPVLNIKIHNNSVYASGQFSSVNGSSSYRHIVRMNLIPGSSVLDINSAWIPTVNSTSAIQALAIADSGLMLSGDFTIMNGEPYLNLAKLSYINSADNTQFNKDSQGSISLSFNRYDLIKPIYMMDLSPEDIDIPITLRDGSGIYNYNVNTFD